MRDTNDVLLGREAVESGWLKSLREKLSMPQAAMAALMGTAAARYRLWEADPGTRLWTKSAQRVGRFYRSALNQIVILDERGVDLDTLVPFMAVAPRLGMTHEGLLARYRRGEVRGEDLGVLGLWMTKAEFREMQQ